jgi:hypothetical protein
MGNKLICNNLYCSQVLPKPDWFSEKTWTILNKNNEINQLKIDKGIITIRDVNEENIYILYKLINISEDFDTFSIPLTLEIKHDTNLRIDIKLTNEPININNKRGDELFGAAVFLKNSYIYFGNKYEAIKSKYKFEGENKYYIEYIFDNREIDNIIFINRIYENNKNIIDSNNLIKKGDFSSKFYINIMIKVTNVSKDNYIKMEIN